MTLQPDTAESSGVVVLVETSTAFGRSLLKGILRYFRLHPPPSLYVAQGPVNQVLPLRDSWRGNGIIARICSPEMERAVVDSGLPYVVSRPYEIEYPLAGKWFGEVRTEPNAIARMAAVHLTETGLQRFAFCGFENCRWSSAYEKAFSQFVRRYGYPCAVFRSASWTWLRNRAESWQQQGLALEGWLRSLEKPVGLMACNDLCGWEVLQACARAELDVPGEVAVIGVGNEEALCEFSDPTLSSIALSVEDAGYRASSLLAALMQNRAVVERIVWVHPTHVVARGSSALVWQDDPVVRRALTIIREHAKNPMSVVDIVGRVGISRRTLERRFSSSVGRTILSEINRFRLRRAEQMLTETDWPCQLVAREAGFGSLRTFLRTFRQEEGCTPKTFRVRAHPARSHTGTAIH